MYGLVLEWRLEWKSGDRFEGTFVDGVTNGHSHELDAVLLEQWLTRRSFLYLCI